MISTATPERFTRLRDVPNSYAGQSGKSVSVKSTEDGLEFTTGGSGGVADTVGVDVVAAEDLAAYEFVTAVGAKADSSNSAHFNKVVGMTTAAVLTGFVASLSTDGEVTNPAWTWSANASLFLNGTSISQTPPSSGFIQVVGVAVNATTMIIQIKLPLLI